MRCFLPRLPQAFPCLSVGAGTLRMGWPSSPSEVLCTSGPTGTLTRGSPCIKRRTPFCPTSVCSGGTQPRRASWCSDTRTEVCRFSSQVGNRVDGRRSQRSPPLTSAFCSGSKSQKHVLRPESLEGTDEEDPVSALEWDLLSSDYLLGQTVGQRSFQGDNLE